MTSNEFVSKLILAWDKDIPSQVREEWLEYLAGFTHDELELIYAGVRRNCKLQPRIAHAQEAAEELGLISKRKQQATGRKQHTWTPTDCPRCGGEGLICGIYRHENEYVSGEIRQHRQLIAIQPYHVPLERDKYDSSFYTYVFRCSCAAGAADTLSRGWPAYEPRKHGSDSRQLSAVSQGAPIEPAKPDFQKLRESILGADTDEIPF